MVAMQCDIVYASTWRVAAFASVNIEWMLSAVEAVFIESCNNYNSNVVHSLHYNIVHDCPQYDIVHSCQYNIVHL